MTFLANVEKNGERFSYKILENQEGGVWTILNYWKGIVSNIVRDEHLGGNDCWGIVSYIIRNKNKGGDWEVSLRRLIQDITAEKHYRRSYTNRRKFHTKIALLFEVEKSLRYYLRLKKDKLSLELILGRFIQGISAERHYCRI